MLARDLFRRLIDAAVAAQSRVLCRKQSRCRDDTIFARQAWHATAPNAARATDRHYAARCRRRYRRQMSLSPTASRLHSRRLRRLMASRLWPADATRCRWRWPRFRPLIAISVSRPPPQAIGGHFEAIFAGSFRRAPPPSRSRQGRSSPTSGAAPHARAEMMGRAYAVGRRRLAAIPLRWLRAARPMSADDATAVSPLCRVHHGKTPMATGDFSFISAAIGE